PWPQLDQVVEVGDAGTRVVDGGAYVRTLAVDGRADRAVVVDRDVLGDLEDHGPVAPGEHRQERWGADQEGRRDVEAQPRTIRQLACRGQRGFERPELEVEPD